MSLPASPQIWVEATWLQSPVGVSVLNALQGFLSTLYIPSKLACTPRLAPRCGQPRAHEVPRPQAQSTVPGRGPLCLALCLSPTGSSRAAACHAITHTHLVFYPGGTWGGYRSSGHGPAKRQVGARPGPQSSHNDPPSGPKSKSATLTCTPADLLHLRLEGSFCLNSPPVPPLPVGAMSSKRPSPQRIATRVTHQAQSSSPLL